MSGKAQLQQIVYELDGIIRNLDDIANGVRTDFEGVGNIQCANTIEEVASHYRRVKRKLAAVDMSSADGYGGGGGGVF